MHLKLSPSQCLLFLSCLLLSSLQVSALLAQSPCDPALSQASTDRNGYRQRGDRCEGIYIQEVSSPALRVVSFTDSVENFKPESGKNLRVEWSLPSATVPVHLRASALRSHLYYRFDTARPAGSASYDWSPSVLQALELTKRELGVLAWYTQPVGNTKRDVYLPVRIGQQGAPARAQRYRLVLVPGTELTEVFVTLSSVKPDGRPGTFVLRDQPLKRGFYPADRGISVPIIGLQAPGLYYLEISATLRAGGSSTDRLWFYHTGG
jgi:hypothetical protein